MKPSRRALLALGIASLPIAALGAVGLAMSYRQVIAESVRRTLSDVNIDDEGLEAFAADFEAHYPKGALKVAALSVSLKFAGSSLLPSFGRQRLRNLGQGAGELFLLSSSYFLSGRAPTAKVVYFRFHDPYESPCANPLARYG